MHNNIMAAGSRDRQLMLAPRRYAQWQSRFMRYIDTSLNGDALRKCILQGPYKLSTIIIPAQLATNDSPAVLERTLVETYLNISPENKAYYDLEKEAIHLLLTGFGDEIYSTVKACKTPHKMWIAIERLQHGESLNIQVVKTNLFWEFGRFTSHDAESMKSYYSRYNSKEIAKPIAPPSESASEEDSDPEQAKRDKDMQKNLALLGSQECMKPKRVKDYTYHKEKMLLCKQDEKGVPLQVEQADWLEDTNDEIDE
ncbi:hypothetical protein Tco_0449770 [Tanacetum coccineum]